MSKKQCASCGKSKKLEKFNKDRRRTQGRRGSCRKCEQKRNREYYQASYTVAERRMRRAFHAAKQRAKKRGADFTITMDDVLPQVELGYCSVTKIPFSHEAMPNRRRNPFAPSIDRIDSSKGYTPDNIRVVIFAFNLMLADFGAEVFGEVAKAYLKEQKRAKPDKSKRKVAQKSPKPRHRATNGVGNKRRERDQRVRSN